MPLFTDLEGQSVYLCYSLFENSLYKFGSA